MIRVSLELLPDPCETCLDFVQHKAKVCKASPLLACPLLFCCQIRIQLTGLRLVAESFCIVSIRVATFSLFNRAAKARQATVCIELPPRFDSQGQFVIPRPYPSTMTEDKWDDVHVKMPYSSQSQFPVKGEDGESDIKSRWSLIEAALDPAKKIVDSKDLESRILSYNQKNRWCFAGLHDLFENVLSSDETQAFFDRILPEMCALALRLPQLVTQPLPLLKQGLNHTATLSQLQIASLLCNSFFCTFPRRNATGKKAEYSNYPMTNFFALYSEGVNPNKLLTLINYFRRVTETTPKGSVSFQRRFVHPSAMPKWSESKSKLRNLRVTAKGTIEDDGDGMLQVDFANSRIGGGVLRRGCVQEEIRFIICPELLASLLFTERMNDNECVVIYGHERYSNYTGYARTYEFAGNHVDPTPVDGESGRRKSALVAIDATRFAGKKAQESQYEEAKIKRELNKAYVGFCNRDE